MRRINWRQPGYSRLKFEGNDWYFFPACQPVWEPAPRKKIGCRGAPTTVASMFRPPWPPMCEIFNRQRPLTLKKNAPFRLSTVWQLVKQHTGETTASSSSVFAEKLFRHKYWKILYKYDTDSGAATNQSAIKKQSSFSLWNWCHVRKCKWSFCK